ncbi:MAG: Ig-like domain-containing protein, partial [Anaerolineales bacterium]|nr:Ig-like domain-containing protein [Anaerolineales bacterium]
PMDDASVRAALNVSPPLMADLIWDESGTVATLDPAGRLPTETTYTIAFTGTLRDQFGDTVPLPAAHSFTTPPAILNAAPTGSSIQPTAAIRVTFDRLMDEAKTAAALSITPAISGTIRWNETTLIFQPDAGMFDEYTEYTVAITSEAVGLEGESVLNGSYSWSFRTTNVQKVAHFGYGPNAQVVDVNGRRTIQYVLTNRANLDSVTFDLYQLNTTQFLDRYASGFRGGAGWETNRPISTEGSVLVTSWPANSSATGGHSDHIREVIIPDDVPPGLYILNLNAGNLNDQIIVVLSSYALVVKQAENQLTTWVTDINGVPAPDAEVQIYARNGTLIAQGTSDSSGVFSTVINRDPEPLIVIAGHGDDRAVSGLTWEWGGSSGWWGSRPTTQDTAVYIYTERPIYRPGQTVFFKAIIRRDDDALLSMLPAGTAVTARMRDARNNVVQTLTLTTNDFGTVDGSFQVAEGAMLGDYAIEIALNGDALRDASVHRQTFKVQDYRKPDYEVILSADSDRYVDGQQIAVTVDSRYFFGEPVANAPLEVNFYSLSPHYRWMSPEDGNDFTWYLSYRTPISGQTDADGRFTFTFDAQANEGYDYYAGYGDWGSNVRQNAWGVEVTVDDGSRQTVSGSAVFYIYSAAEKVTLNNFDYFQTPEQPFTVQAAVNTINGEPVNGRALTLSLRRWNRDSRSYTTVIQSAQLTSDANGRASHTLTIQQPGYYQIRVSGTDSQGHTIAYNRWVYVFNTDFADWYGIDSALRVTADQESYAPGDAAHLLIESAFDGPALLTFERGTTRRTQLVELTAPVTAVTVTIQPDDAPNTFVTVNAWEGVDTTLSEEMWQSLADSQLHQATVELLVPVTGKTLLVTITPDRETYAPRDEASFTVRVTNEYGEPVSAEVSLAMVDEAIFALSADLSGPMFNAFYFQRRNLVNTYNAFAPSRYLWESGGGGMGGGGGDGDLIANPRQDFPDTAAWFPTLHTDWNGEATVTVTLPDNLTSWRLTAKAATADTQVGEAVANITVHQDVIVRPILPRTLTAHDEVQLSALVHNYTESTQTITVQLLVPNSLFTIHHSPSLSVTVPAGGVRVVGWLATAVSAGTADLTVQASIGDVVVDAVQLPLEIRPLAIPDVTTQIGQFSGDLATTIDMPAGALPISSARIELSRSIAGTLLEGLEYLTGYPYGCVEQTMSRALPNAVVGRAFNQLGVGSPTLQADLPAKINASLQRLYGYQHNDGG